MERSRNFLQDESGASAAEYAILIALIAMACVYAISLLGINLADVFTTVANAFP